VSKRISGLEHNPFSGDGLGLNLHRDDRRINRIYGLVDPHTNLSHERSKRRITVGRFFKGCDVNGSVHQGLGKNVRQAMVGGLPGLGISLFRLAPDLAVCESVRANVDLYQIVQINLGAQLQSGPNNQLSVVLHRPVLKLDLGSAKGTPSP